MAVVCFRGNPLVAAAQVAVVDQAVQLDVRPAEATTPVIHRVAFLSHPTKGMPHKAVAAR